MHEQRATVLREAGWRHPPALTASMLGDLAQVVLDRYRGDLRRLRTEVKRNPSQVCALLTELPGVDNGAVDLFFREIQALWPEVEPFADRHALMAARRLALGQSARDLAELVRAGGTEKLSWLVGALARINLDNRYNTLKLARP
ncbi:hypothetical protein [Kibdelosporangium aridum]|uniref:hypothetical protein n=1 Tax=Kibdelosporangium aridum TaxID=2030 RepID=UPI001C8BF621|nr:hypothetical protein [Kibdelosporangium aridum]